MQLPKLGSRIKFKTIILFIALMMFYISLIGCAPTATGPNFKIIENAPQNKATVYFYRPYKALGAALSEIGIEDNGSPICPKVLMNGYCVNFMEPGTHTLNTSSSAVDKRIKVEVNQGDTLFFKAQHECGMWICSYILVPIEKKYALKEIANYKLQEN